MSTETTLHIDEFRIRKVQYDSSTHAYYYFYIDGKDESVGYLAAKTMKAVEKKVINLRAVLAEKEAKRIAASTARAERQRLSDEARGIKRDECQICVGSWVIENGVTSRHGYTRPGDGWLHGSCMGARELPYSQSCDVLKRYLASLFIYRTDLAERLERTRAAVVITRMETDYDVSVGSFQKRPMKKVTYKKGEKNFDHIKAMACLEVESEQRRLVDEIARIEKRIADWKAPTT
jgi:hypothetical protein